MKLAIVSDPQRGEKDSPLLMEASSFFEKVLFVPIGQIRVDLAENFAVKYGQINLADYDCVLPIPTLTYKEVFYITMRVLSNSTYLPINADRYIMATDEALLFKHLRQNNIRTREVFVVSSDMSMKELLKKTKFPIIVRMPYKRVIVTNSKTLQDVLSLAKVGTPVLIEPPMYAERNILSFVVGGGIITSYERIGEVVKPVEAGEEIKKLAEKISQAVECDYCALNFFSSKNQWILGKFMLSPDFQNIQEITSKNVARALLEHLAEKSKKHKERKMGEKISKLFRR
ncbi:MAG TPA: hypothetical protein VJ343_01130 [archaeon]|nr:hypothetical protein [archaeon]